MIAQGAYEAAAQMVSVALEYFRSQTLYYYEAQASMAMAVCESKLEHEPQFPSPQ